MKTSRHDTKGAMAGREWRRRVVEIDVAELMPFVIYLHGDGADWLPDDDPVPCQSCEFLFVGRNSLDNTASVRDCPLGQTISRALGAAHLWKFTENQIK
ncbi:MAG: hypothetical protein NTW21_16200 [Verrucomicrobia bacterium]|nr:hypothetical protein [Verrucomicrobiota bacterium]